MNQARSIAIALIIAAAALLSAATYRTTQLVEVELVGGARLYVRPGSIEHLIVHADSTAAVQLPHVAYLIEPAEIGKVRAAMEMGQ